MTEGKITKPLSKTEHQQTGSGSDNLQVDVKIKKEANNFQKENKDDGIFSKETQFAILGHAENKAKEPLPKTQTKKNLEKRKLSMGLAILSRPDGGGTVEQGTKQQKRPKINVGKNRMNSAAESSMVTSWRQKIPLTEDVMIKPKAAMGLRKVVRTMRPEKAEDEGDVMPGPGKEILDTLNAWHERRWQRLLDEYKIRGEGTSGISKGWEDTIIRNWPKQSREKEKVEEMKVRMQMKMKEMEENVKLQKEGNEIEVPDLGKIWLHNEEEEREVGEMDEEDEMLISLPALGEARIPSRGRGGDQREQLPKRRRRVFRRQQISPSRASLKSDVKNSQSSIERPKETSAVTNNEPTRDRLDSKLSLDDLPKASSSPAMRALHFLKTALQKRPATPTSPVDRFDRPRRTSLLTRGLTMLRTALQRPPAAPPTVVERFPILPPRRVRPPSTLVSLLRLGWEKLTPRLTIR